MGSSSWQKCPKSKNPSTSASPWLRFHRSNLLGMTPRGARQCAGLSRDIGANGVVQHRARVHRVQNGRPADAFRPPSAVCVASDNARCLVRGACKREPVVCLIVVPGKAAAWRCFAPKVTARHASSRRSAQASGTCCRTAKILRLFEFVAQKSLISRFLGGFNLAGNRQRSWGKTTRTSCRAASRSTAGTMHAQLQVKSWACRARRLLPCRFGAEKASRSRAD